jgi:choline dehydrogenase-like flavoprotein
MAATSYDALVIGAGQAGGLLAGALAKVGRRTAVMAEVGDRCSGPLCGEARGTGGIPETCG